MIGNFKRQGTVSCKGKPKAYDHDFKSFSDGIIVPYGIYDVGANTGYLTLGVSHDTAEFVCDNFIHIWQQFLQWKYPNAHTICILCDGGGSNACSHHIVKQALMKLASTIGVNIIMVHFPSILLQIQSYRALHVWTNFKKLEWRTTLVHWECKNESRGYRHKERTLHYRYNKSKNVWNEKTQWRILRIKQEQTYHFDDELSKWNYLVKCCS